MGHPVDLLARVVAAERTLKAGDWRGGLLQFATLASQICANHGAGDPFDHNGSLVLHRCADVAVRVGCVEEALAFYKALGARAATRESRALAAFKRLDLALQFGAFRIYEEVCATIDRSVWTGLPPIEAGEASMSRWERAQPWAADQRDAIFAVMYLALGRQANANRLLAEATRYLHRGLQHALSSKTDDARLVAIPLRLASARNELARGQLQACRASLTTIEKATATGNPGASYRLWLLNAQAELALVEGRLADALRLLDEVDKITMVHQLAQARCRCLVVRAELSILLNLLPEAEADLRVAGELIATEPRTLRPAVARAWNLLTRRREELRLLPVSMSVRELHDPSAEPPASTSVAGVAQTPESYEQVVATGDCLRDYEIRELLIHANVDRDIEQARRDTDDLIADFGSIESPLLQARVHAMKGLIDARCRDLAGAARSLSHACRLFADIGAEREAYQVTLLLARAVRQTDPGEYHRLLAENDDRLLRLAAGLPTERRNAFIATRYSSTQDYQRVQIEQIVALRNLAKVGGAPLWRRLQDHVRWRVRLHDMICRRDDDEDRARDEGRRLPMAPRRRGLRGLLRRLAFHPWRTQTVGYFVLPDRTFMYAVRWGRLDGQLLDLTRLKLNWLHESLMAAGTETFNREARSACETLGLQDTLATLPSYIRSFTIVPHGHLHVVPFCALRYTRSDGVQAYVIERVAIGFDTTSDGRRPPSPRVPRRAIVSWDSGKEIALPNASKAAEEAASWLQKYGWPEIRPVDRRSACLAGLADATVFYYFGHGRFDPDHPEQSGVRLLDDDGRSDWLTLRSIDEVRPHCLEQAVVLGCHGGDVIVVAGRVVSVPGLLLRLGARSVFTALWEIDEPVAIQVSARFFELAPKMGRARALQRIQLELRTKFHDPLLWASFQVHGDGGKLPVARGRLPWLNRTAR
jgi:hypothetical protein